ncbi:SPOR domain-containing protein [Tenacibaculum aestuariivivum]|uniref:SPOR domain-containing protein n=1 Tax=Tenacibaculum aestuariivivum TaxID=2006131 RepID=UPI003AB12AA5
MPFIEEDKFNSMQEDLENAKLKVDEVENELNETKSKFVSFKKKSKRIPVLLGLLLGLSLGACYYFYTKQTVVNSFSETEIIALKKKEGIRLLDSIEVANTRNNINENTNVTTENLEETINEVSENINGETIYSVQIGVLSEKKFPLLSSTTIPTTVTSNNGYFKYSVGLFSTLNEARNLRKELVTLGFDDAFIASYIDGKRQKIHN